MSYHVENTRFKELPESIIVHEDGYMWGYKNEGLPIIDYVYVRDRTCEETEIEKFFRGCSNCGYMWEYMYGIGHRVGPNFCPCCGAKVRKAVSA